MRLRYRIVLCIGLIACAALLLYGPVAIQSAREAARRRQATENLKQLKTAMDAYMQREESGVGQLGIPPKRRVTEDLISPRTSPSD